MPARRAVDVHLLCQTAIDWLIDDCRRASVKDRTAFGNYRHNSIEKLSQLKIALFGMGKLHEFTGMDGQT